MSPSEQVRPLSRRAVVAIVVGTILVVLMVVIPRLVAVYTDWLWYGEVGYRSVWGTVLITRLVLFLAVTVAAGALFLGVTVWAYRSRPILGSEGNDPLAEYRRLILRRPKLVAIGLAALLAILFGAGAQGHWTTVQLFLHGGSFGTTDAEFGHDVGFYVFDLPFYRLLLTWLFVAVFIALLLSVGTQYLFGGIRLSVSTLPKRPKDARRIVALSRPARTQLALLAGMFIAIKAVAYWFDRYQLLWSEPEGPDIRWRRLYRHQRGVAGADDSGGDRGAVRLRLLRRDRRG